MHSSVQFPGNQNYIYYCIRFIHSFVYYICRILCFYFDYFFVQFFRIFLLLFFPFILLFWLKKKNFLPLLQIFNVMSEKNKVNLKKNVEITKSRNNVFLFIYLANHRIITPQSVRVLYWIEKCYLLAVIFYSSQNNVACQ